MEHIINLFNNLSKIPKTVLLALALTAPIIYIVAKLEYVDLYIPNFSKYVRESETLMPSLWMISIFLILYLAICALIFIKDYLYKIYSNQKQQKHIQDTQKHLLEQQIKMLLNMTNSAKKLLCDTFEQHPKGETIEYRHDNPIKHIVADLVRYKVFNNKLLKGTPNLRSGISQFWINPEIHALLSKDNQAIFHQIRNSIPS